jgi:beta-galactosidase
VNDGRWHHVAGVYDGRKLSLYVDGQLDAFVPTIAVTRINTNKDSVCLGMNSGNPKANEWNGLIDDVRIYSYALPPEDIKAIHGGQGAIIGQGFGQIMGLLCSAEPAR